MGHLDASGWSAASGRSTLRRHRQGGYPLRRGAVDDKGWTPQPGRVPEAAPRQGPARPDVILLRRRRGGHHEFGIDTWWDHWDKIDCEYALNRGGTFNVQGAGCSTRACRRRRRSRAACTCGTGTAATVHAAARQCRHAPRAGAKIGPGSRRCGSTRPRASSSRGCRHQPAEQRAVHAPRGPGVQETLRGDQHPLQLHAAHLRWCPHHQGGFRENVIPAERKRSWTCARCPMRTSRV